MDIIDAFMRKGSTYVGACKKLFEYAEISFDYSESNIKTRRNYRYPCLENGNDKVMRDYLHKRKISDDTIDYLGITSDTYGNVAFNYYDLNDTLCMVKYRLSRPVNKEKHENKAWCQKGADTCNLLYNINKTNPNMPLLILEGETEVASAIEIGWYNAVSINLGCNNFNWIDECWDILQQFPELIISFDNDEPGIKARKEAMDRLGTSRCKFIEYPHYFEKKDSKGNIISKVSIKDLNDMIQFFSPSYIFDMIINAQEVPIDTVVDLFSVEDTDVYDMEGVESGLKTLDDKLVGFFFKSLTLISGKSGAGKTSLIDQVILNSIDNGYKVFLFSLEMSSATSANWMNLIAAGRRNVVKRISKKGKEFYAVSDEAKIKIKNKYINMIQSYKDDESNSVDKVFESMEACVRRKGCKVIVIDNLMMLDLACGEQEKNQAQTNLINRLIRFSKEFNVAIFLVCHLRKSQGSFDAEGLDEIAGSSNIGNLAMRSIQLKKITDKQKTDPKFAYANYSVILSISKDRFTGQAGKEIPLHYDMISRRFFTDYEELDRKYSFDTNTYNDRLDYEFEDDINPFN